MGTDEPQIKLSIVFHNLVLGFGALCLHHGIVDCSAILQGGIEATGSGTDAASGRRTSKRTIARRIEVLQKFFPRSNVRGAGT